MDMYTSCMILTKNLRSSMIEINALALPSSDIVIPKEKHLVWVSGVMQSEFNELGTNYNDWQHGARERC